MKKTKDIKSGTKHRRMKIELDNRWVTMEEVIRRLEMILEGLTEEPIRTEEYIGIYTAVFDLRVQNVCSTAVLNDKYKASIDDYVESKVVPSLREKHGEFLLRDLLRRWTDHKTMVKSLSHYFSSLDRDLSYKKLTPLREAGLASFRGRVCQEFASKAADVVTSLIDRERGGLLIDRALLKNVADMYVEVEADEQRMEFYENDFEKPVLDGTDGYYSKKALEWIAEDSCPEYMVKVEECLRKEKDRASHYLHSSSETKLVERVRNQLLVVHMNQLLEKEGSGCQALIRYDKVEDLSRMHRLFQQIPQGLERIADVFMKHVSSEGKDLIKQAEDGLRNADKKRGGAQELEFAKKLIELHVKYSRYVIGCFLNGSLFYKALADAFEAFCNKDIGGTSIAQILALYCDDILKKGAEKLSDEAIDETMDKVINLLVHIGDQDFFAEFHRMKLSGRLLVEKGTNIELEKSILMKLKQQFGGHLISKMEGMVTDMTLAKENQDKFQDYLNYSLGMEFSVAVLTAGRWPTYKSSDLNLPTEMAKCVEVFNEFYKTTTNSRRLTWIYSLGTCNIKAKFEKNDIELIVGTYQAAVLLLFNTEDKLSYSEIKTHLNLKDEDLSRSLHSLSCAKYKILNKVPNTKTVSQEDYFEFNSKFTDKMRRIRIPVPLAKERKKVVEVVKKDRRCSIDAAVVRIMKSRKSLGYQQLIGECVEQLSNAFKPDVKEIKRRIECLIEQEYLERDKTNPNMFTYLA